MIFWSNLSPATLSDVLITEPPIEITAISVVPPPISTTKFPHGLAISIPAPIAAATGSSIKYAFFAPACIATSITALFSTSVICDGTQIIILKPPNVFLLQALFIKYLSIFDVAVKLDITPSLRGLIASILLGVLPIIFLASFPTAKTSFVSLFIATTDGSLNTIPFPFTQATTVAVPKSIPMSSPEPIIFIFLSKF